MSPRQSSAIWNPLLSRSNCSSSFPFSLFVHQEGGLQARLLLNKAGRPRPAADSPPSERLTEGYCSRRLWAHSEVTPPLIHPLQKDSRRGIAPDVCGHTQRSPMPRILSRETALRS